MQNDPEDAIRRELMSCIRHGRPKVALDLYKKRTTPFQSAHSYLILFMAARKAGKNRAYLAGIEDSAKQCADYDEAELDFARERAIFTARRERRLDEAEAALWEVLRRRHTDEKQIYSKGVTDEVALCEVWLLKGDADLTTRYLRGLIEHDNPAGQTLLEAKWLFSLSCVLSREDSEALDTARVSLRLGQEPNLARQMAWYGILVPRIGLPIARTVLERWVRSYEEKF